jgi:DNA-binding Lrp family transcriptional regulator
MVFDMYDDLDRLIVQALQVNGRAPFSLIAGVLGVSDQTVARRYARMRSSGACKVVGLVDPYAGAGVPWLVRLRCAPSSSAPLGEALARRDDTAWIRLTSGGTEIVCEAKSRDGNAPLLQQLPRSPRVEQISAHCLLHMYFGGAGSPIEKLGGLSEEQVGVLRGGIGDAGGGWAADGVGGAGGPGRIGPVGIEARDAPLLAALAQDGRADLVRLAAQTGLSAATVSRRVTELRRGGALYFDIDFDARLFPMFAVQTLLWLAVEPAALDAAGRMLAADPQIAFAAATTGTTNLHATVSCPDMAATYRYLTDHVATVPGIRAMETAPILRELKRAA